MFPRSYYPARPFAPRYFAAGAHSSAGYRVYHRPTPTSPRQLVAAVAPAPGSTPGTGTFVLTGLAPGSSGDYEVRAVSRCGAEDIEPLRLRRVRMDDAAVFVGPTPNAPTALQLTPLAGGHLRATWIHLPGGQAASPARFVVRAATLPGSIDYDAEGVSVAAGGLRQYTVTLGPFINGDVVRVNVQAVAAAADGGAADGNRLEIQALVDSAAPAAATHATVTTTPSR